MSETSDYRFSRYWWMKKLYQGLDMYTNIAGISRYHTSASWAGDDLSSRKMYLPSPKVTPKRKGDRLEGFPKKKMPKFFGPVNKPATFRKGNSVVNALAGKASMKKRGSSHLKGTKGKKKVKVSTKLKKQIKQVITGEGVYGEFVKMYNGTIGVLQAPHGTSPPQSGVSCPDFGAQYFSYYPDSTNGSTNNMTHWATPLENGSGLSVSQYTIGKEFVYFTPAKVLDAASVLWNKKTGAQSPWSEVGNLNTRSSSGVPTNATFPNLKIQVRSCHVEFELKNNSQRAVTVVIRHCTPKMKVAPAYPLNTLINGLAADVASTGPIIADTVGAQLYTSPIIPWTAVPNFNNTWKYETVTIVIKPGETCTHTLKGPSNKEFDFSKYTYNGTDFMSSIVKGSVCAVMSVIPDLVVADNPASVVNRTSRFIGVDSTVADPISLQIKEVYKLYMPEVVGFTNFAVATGSTQPLDLRQTRKAYLNFGSLNPVEGTQTYVTVDEEQPNTLAAHSNRN